MEMIITFPGGKRVDAISDGQTIRTDQPVEEGGEGSAPEPFTHFLAAIGTCAGIYVWGFFNRRNLPTKGLRIIQRMDWNEEAHRLERVALDIVTPSGFPEKYKKAVIRAADQCTVKRTLFDPPVFEIRTVDGEG